jgi:type IV fimbrial biogenesis protein FimT
MTHRRHSGLTLIEILVALAIVAVLGLVTVPAMGTRLEQSRLSHAAEQLAADLTEARYEAARRGRALHLLVHPGPGWCWSVATEPACPCGQRLACELRHAQEHDHGGIALAGGHSMQLSPDGSAQQPGSATLQASSGPRLRVELMALGRPRICSEGGSLTRYPAC